MADTIRLQVIDAVETALNGASKPATLTVDRKEYRPVEAASLPRAVPYIAPSGRQGAAIERTQTRVSTMIDRFLRVLVEVQVSFEPATETPDAVADPFLSWVEQAVMADESLGGIADQIAPPLLAAKEVSEDGKAIARYGLEFEVQYQTLRTNPEAQS